MTAITTFKDELYSVHSHVDVVLAQDQLDPESRQGKINKFHNDRPLVPLYALD